MKEKLVRPFIRRKRAPVFWAEGARRWLWSASSRVPLRKEEKRKTFRRKGGEKLAGASPMSVCFENVEGREGKKIEGGEEG